MPGALGAAVGERLGERAVGVAALRGARAVVDGGAHERVVELDLAAAQREQAGRLGRLERVGGQAGVGERAGDHVGAHRLGAGGDEQRVARRLGQRVDAAPEGALERLAGAQRAEREVAPRALVGAQPARDLAQRERVARRRGEQLVDHRGREAVGLGGQHAARARLVEAVERAACRGRGRPPPRPRRRAARTAAPRPRRRAAGRRTAAPRARPRRATAGRRRPPAPAGARPPPRAGSARAAATAKRSVTGAASSASAPPSACAWTGGISLRRSSSGDSSSESAANGSSDSDSIPRARRTAQPVGVVGGVAQQRRLAHAGLAVHEQRRAAPLPRRLDHAPEPSALLVTSDQQGLGVYGCSPSSLRSRASSPSSPIERRRRASPW